MFRLCRSPHDAESNEGDFVHLHSPSKKLEPIPSSSIPKIPILAEIVGATNLRAAMAGKNQRKSTVSSLPDAHCVVRLIGTKGGDAKVVHSTDVIRQDENPIFTVKTRSLCVLQIPNILHDEIAKNDNKNPESADASPASSLEACDKSSNKELVKAGKEVGQPKAFLVVEVCHGKKCLGKVEISLEHILKCQGEREEFTIVSASNREVEVAGQEDPSFAAARDSIVQQEIPSVLAKSQENQKAKLALRFRPAKEKDIQLLAKIEKSRNESLLTSSAQSVKASFTKSASTLAIDPSSQTEPSHEVEATDLSFKHVTKRSLLAAHKKTDVTTGETFHRLQPPKPSAADEKTVDFMTKTQIQNEAHKPSQKWVETGHGELGTLFLEVIGCDNLPDLDMGTSDLTDPFVACVFEDNMVRTRVLWDSLHPRWMPWSTRAFAFNITHPGSSLFLGVFDYDEDFLVTDYHDPVGRVVVNTINFESGVSYLLHYDLIHSEKADEPRGTITIRLRIVWKDENEAAKEALAAPPPFVINVESMKSWHVLHYCLHGGINMDKASIASVKIYLSEVASYWRHYCFFLDVLANILLWRGREELSLVGYSVNIWCPIQSLWLFTSVFLAFEKPHLRASIFFYSLAWIMISINRYNSRHPYPWYRVKSFESLVMGLIRGPSRSSSTIESNVAAVTKSHYDALDKLRADRMATLISAFISTALKAYRLYSGTSFANAISTTEDPSSYFLSDKLYYPHMALKYLCNYCRAFRSFICWQSHGSFPKTLRCLLLGTLCLLAPVRLVATWTGRILIWVFLSPHVKFLDMIWIQKYFKTYDQLLDDIINDRSDEDYYFFPFFEEIIEHDTFHSMRSSGRIVSEDATKLRDIRDCVQGPLSERVPLVDNSSKFSYPLPQSSAKPCGTAIGASEDRLHWIFVAGNRFEGNMTMQQPGPPPSGVSSSILQSKKDQ